MRTLKLSPAFPAPGNDHQKNYLVPIKDFLTGNTVSSEAMTAILADTDKVKSLVVIAKTHDGLAVIDQAHDNGKCIDADLLVKRLKQLYPKTPTIVLLISKINSFKPPANTVIRGTSSSISPLKCQRYKAGNYYAVTMDNLIAGKNLAERGWWVK